MHVKTMSAILVLFILLGTSGCSGKWRRKFVRNKKGVEKDEPILQPVDYSKEFSNQQLYANHFAFWKNSESELIACIKSEKSEKRTNNYASYAMTELKKLKSLLVDDKRSELEPFIVDFSIIFDKIQRPHYTKSHKNTLTKDLQKHHRAVSKQFSYFHMKQFIRPDDEDENTQEATPKDIKSKLEELRQPPKEEIKKVDISQSDVTEFNVNELNEILNKHDKPQA